MTAPLGNVKASVPPEQLKAKMNPRRRFFPRIRTQRQRFHRYFCLD